MFWIIPTLITILSLGFAGYVFRKTKQNPDPGNYGKVVASTYFLLAIVISLVSWIVYGITIWLFV